MSQYEAAIRARGYDVRLVSAGAQALAMAATARLDCVVIDVRLPDMTGWELCRQIKAIHRHCEVPIVILAPDLSKESVERLPALSRLRLSFAWASTGAVVSCGGVTTGGFGCTGGLGGRIVFLMKDWKPGTHE